MNRYAQLGAIGLILTVVAGCGGGSASSGSTPIPVIVSITVSPTTGNVQTGSTLQFAATVSGTTNTAATWQVNGLLGGTAAAGTISTSGLYTAPSSVPTPNTVTITAVSSADSTKSAPATVTILPPPVSVAVSPTTVGVITLHSQQFAATVSNTSNTAVAWSVNGTTGGSATVGTISTAGLYTAPSLIPSAPVVTVTATSVVDTTKSASSQVTIVPPPIPTGTWSYLGPAGASDSVQLVADPNNAQTLYTAPIHGGLYKTTNLGGTWTQLLGATGVPFTLLIAPASGTLYVLSEAQFQVSTDAGKTFSSAITYPGGLDSETTAFTLAVDPKNDQTLYLLTSTSLLRSRDGGSTWTGLTPPSSPYLVNGVQAPAVGTLLVSSNNSSFLMSASSSGFAISKDGGTTWQLQNSGLDPNFLSLRQLVQDPVNPSRLLCLGIYPGISPNSYIYVSLDSGLTWTHQGTAYVTSQLPQGQTGPGIYFISGSLYATFDGGVTYKNIGPPHDQTGFAAVMSPTSSNVIAYEGPNDLSVSQDGGTTWLVSETGINGRVMGQVVYAGTSGPLYAATLFTTFAQLWRTPDVNMTWSRPVDAYSGLPILQFDVDPANSLHLVGIEQQTNISGTAESSLSSTDGGATWTLIPYAAGMQDQFQAFQFSAIRFGAPSSNNVFACGKFGIARLSTVTNIWTITNNGMPSGTSCTALGVDRFTSGTLYATTTSGVYKSIDGGNNWSLLFQNSSTYVTVLVDPKNSNNVFLSGGLSMRSTDAGKTWSSMNVGGVMAINPTNSNLMYAVTSNKLYASLDAGLTWASIASPVNFLEDLVVSGSGAVVISTNGSGLVEFNPN